MTPSRTRNSAAFVLLLGVFALLVAFMQPGSGRAVGYFVSTIGIWAVVGGIRFLRAHPYAPRTSRGFARTGITLGAIASAVMAYSMLVVGLTPLGVALPPDPVTMSRLVPDASLTSAGSAPLASGPLATTQPAPIISPTTPRATVPGAITGVQPETPLAVFPTPTSEVAEVSQLTLVATRLSHGLATSHPAGSAWPSHLYSVYPDGEQIIELQGGHQLTDAPSTTRVLYSVSSDGSEYSFELIGRKYGATARYDSMSNQVSTSMP